MGSALRPSARQCGFDWSASPAILVGKVETGLTLAAQAGTGKEFFWRPGLLPITRKVGLRKGGPKVEISHADAAVIAIHRVKSVSLTVSRRKESLAILVSLHTFCES